eukprot:sb/3463907/
METDESTEVFIEFGPDGRVTSVSNTRSSRQRQRPPAAPTRQIPRAPPVPRSTNAAGDAAIRRRNQRISSEGVETPPLINFANPDLSFHEQVQHASRMFNPFGDASDSPVIIEPGSPSPVATPIIGGVAIDPKLMELLQVSTPFTEKFRPLLAISLQQPWFTRSYAQYIEDSITFVRSYFAQIGTAVKYNGGQRTFWERHVGLDAGYMTISQCMNGLYHDYLEEIGFIGRPWMFVCLSTFLTETSEDKISRALYDHVIIEPHLDSFDGFYINIKQLIMLAFITMEFLRPCDDDIKVSSRNRPKQEILSGKKKGALYNSLAKNTTGSNQEPTETSKQPIRTRYLGQVTGYQPIKDQYFQIRLASNDTDWRVRREFCKSSLEFLVDMDTSFFEVDDYNDEVNIIFGSIVNQEPTETTNQNSLFRSRDWLSANQGPVFSDSVGSRTQISKPFMIFLAHVLKRSSGYYFKSEISKPFMIFLAHVLKRSSGWMPFGHPPGQGKNFIEQNLKHSYFKINSH